VCMCNIYGHARAQIHTHIHIGMIYRYTHTIRAVFLSVRNLLCILSVSFSVFLFYLFLFFAPPADDLMTWLTTSVSRTHHTHTHTHTHASTSTHTHTHTFYLYVYIIFIIDRARIIYSIVTLHVRVCNIHVHHQ